MTAVAARLVAEPPDPRDSVVLRLVECELRAYISELRTEARELRASANGKANGRGWFLPKTARMPQDGREP